MACLFALLLAATNSMAQPPGQNDDEAQPQASCPLFLRGSKLTISEIDRGVQLTITTSNPDSVHPVRTMTHNAASYVESYERPHGLPPLELTVADVSQGAKMSVKAENAADVAPLREQAKKLAELWRTDDCINGESTPHHETKLPAERALRT
jgi:TusA-related sulfurtransferase